MKRCFDSNIKKFIEIEQDQWLGEMINNFKLIFTGEFPSDEQVLAWKDCFVKLQKELKKLSSLEGHIIFEYLLPMEGGMCFATFFSSTVALLKSTTIFS